MNIKLRSIRRLWKMQLLWHFVTSRHMMPPWNRCQMVISIYVMIWLSLRLRLWISVTRKWWKLCDRRRCLFFTKRVSWTCYVDLWVSTVAYTQRLFFVELSNINMSALGYNIEIERSIKSNNSESDLICINRLTVERLHGASVNIKIQSK